jgi:hypothetical protein
MKSLRTAFLCLAAFAVLLAPAIVPAQKSHIGESITTPGQTLTTSEGTWTLAKDGETSAGYAVRLNGKDVGYAVKLEIGRNGYPIATHRDGAVYDWIGDTFKLVRK